MSMALNLVNWLRAWTLGTRAVQLTDESALMNRLMVDSPYVVSVLRGVPHPVFCSISLGCGLRFTLNANATEAESIEAAEDEVPSATAV